MYVSGPNNVGRAVQTLWCYALEIMELMKCLELLAQKFEPVSNFVQQLATTCNDIVTGCAIGCNIIM